MKTASDSKRKTAVRSGARLEEFSLIDSIMRPGQGPTHSQLRGYGDDCAVIPLSSESSLLVTLDTLVDGVHFNRSFSSMFDVGWKTLAVSLSDIYAMNGVPEYFFISLQVSSSLSDAAIKEMYDGLYSLADVRGVKILGGDTVHSETFAVSGTLLGKSQGSPILRTGAQDGDGVWISGPIGEAAAGLALLQKEINASCLSQPERCIQRHQRPNVCEVGLEGLALTSMIDVSDGIFQDAAHLSRCSDVDIYLELSDIESPFKEPVDQKLLLRIISGGDDYHLLFTAPEDVRGQLSAMEGMRCIGTVQKKGGDCPQVYLRHQGIPPEGVETAPVEDVYKRYNLPLGFQHF